MAKLNREQKVWIVEQLAMYLPPIEIVAEFEKRFGGLKTSISQVCQYDADNVSCRMAKDWRAIFAATRASFLAEVGKIGIANRAVRVRNLDRIMTDNMRKGNHAMAMQAMEQAAKDLGDALTNKRVVKGAVSLDLSALSDEDLDAEERGLDEREADRRGSIH